MKEIRIDNTSRKDFHQFMLGAVIPRPIALISTVDRNGVRNLAPFSYFNAVSSIPPVLMFSLSRKGADGIKKDTLINIEETGEFTVNMVSYPMVWPMVLSSAEFPPEADEFEKTGFTALDSKHITPPRVRECLIQFECKLREIKELGGNKNDCTIIFGDVVCLYVDDSILDNGNRIDPARLDIIGRLGKQYYTRILPESIFSAPLNMSIIPTGYDRLPEHIRKSITLTANEIAMLAAIPYVLFEKYAYSRTKSPENIEAVIQNHLAIRQALLRADEEKAVQLMRGQ